MNGCAKRIEQEDNIRITLSKLFQFKKMYPFHYRQVIYKLIDNFALMDVK